MPPYSSACPVARPKTIAIGLSAIHCPCRGGAKDASARNPLAASCSIHPLSTATELGCTSVCLIEISPSPKCRDSLASHYTPRSGRLSVQNSVIEDQNSQRFCLICSKVYPGVQSFACDAHHKRRRLANRLFTTVATPLDALHRPSLLDKSEGRSSGLWVSSRASHVARNTQAHSSDRPVTAG